MPGGSKRKALDNLQVTGIEKPILNRVEEILERILREYGFLYADYSKEGNVKKVEAVLRCNYHQIPAEFRNRCGTNNDVILVLYRRCKGISNAARKAAYSTHPKASQPHPSQPVERQDKRAKDNDNDNEVNSNKRKRDTVGSLRDYSLIVVHTANPSVTSCCRMADICHGGDPSSTERISYSKLMDVLVQDFKGTATDVNACRIVYYLKTGGSITIRNSRQLCTAVQIACQEPELSNIITIFLESKASQRDEKPSLTLSPSCPATGSAQMAQSHRQENAASPDVPEAKSRTMLPPASAYLPVNTSISGLSPQQQERTISSRAPESNAIRTSSSAFTSLPATTSPLMMHPKPAQQATPCDVPPFDQPSTLSSAPEPHQASRSTLVEQPQHERQPTTPDTAGSKPPATLLPPSSTLQTESDTPNLRAPLRQQPQNVTPNQPSESDPRTLCAESETPMTPSPISLAAARLRQTRSTNNPPAFDKRENQRQLWDKHVAPQDFRLAENQQQQHGDGSDASMKKTPDIEAPNCAQQ